jgi:hypothetical protein
MSMQDESIISHKQVLETFKRRKQGECRRLLETAFEEGTRQMMKYVSALAFNITVKFPYVLPEYVKEELVKDLKTGGWENYTFEECGKILTVRLNSEEASSVDHG